MSEDEIFRLIEESNEMDENSDVFTGEREKECGESKSIST